MQKLTLSHYWRSSCSWRVRWALALKNVAYESVPVNLLHGEQGGAANLARNPAGFVPALEIDGQFYGESLALIEWIDETWKTPALYPAPPLDRLRVRQLALTIVAGTQPLQNLVTMKHYEGDDAARRGHAQFFIAKGLATYEALLAHAPSGAFSFGDQITVADLCLIPQVYNALRFDVDLSATPKIRAIYERALATPACQASHPQKQPGATP